MTVSLLIAQQLVLVVRVPGDNHYKRITCVAAGVARFSMTICAEQIVKICSPSPVMVTSPYEKKILEWDDKPQTEKK